MSPNEKPCGSDDAGAVVGTRRLKVLAQSVLAVLLLATFSQSAFAQYTWNNVRIVAGGFVPGIVYHPNAQGLVYARTDIGGLYKSTNGGANWTPLLDWVNWSNWGYSGVLSVAVDPENANTVYAAVGGYTNSWDPNNGAILKSTDQGSTWTVAPLPFKIGGNMPGRGNGERLAVDPNNSNLIYFGATGNTTSTFGLWKSTNGGSSWSQVTSFTAVGDWQDDPTDPNGYNSQKQGIFWVNFDPRTVVSGVTQNIYVGVATKTAPTIYHSSNGGSTWSAIPGQPTTDCGGDGIMPTKAAIDPTTGTMYVTYGEKAGPYDDEKGDVYTYNSSTGAWTNVTPVTNDCMARGSGNIYFGFNGLSVSKSNPNVVMETGHSSWWPDTWIFRSTNNDVTATNVWHWTRYPSMGYEIVYPQDISMSPWLKFPASPVCSGSGGGRPGPIENPKIGWMTAALAIDPFNTNNFLYGTGATIYGSSNANLWGSGTLANISVMANGIEETSIIDFAVPPSGPMLLSGVGDIRGFYHTDVTKVPSAQYNALTSTNSLDFGQGVPAQVVRAGNGDSSNCENSYAYSTNGGQSWTIGGGQPSGVTGSNNDSIAISPDGKRVVWAPNGTTAAYTSTNWTAASPTWTAITGLPAQAKVRADRLTVNKFYGFANGVFYVSTNGTSFTAASSAGLPTSAKIVPVYNKANDVWLVSPDPTTGGVWHTTDGGTTFTKVTSVVLADGIGFGAPVSGATYPTIFLAGEVGTVRGYYASTDGGNTWKQINDSNHNWYYSGYVITGDPNRVGRVYIATNGRGIIYGDGTP
jgi:xyloglucan-specific exo-beta-1,4-glucanase